MARKPDPNSCASKIKAAYYDDKKDIEEISEELGVPIGRIHRVIWRHENQEAQRAYDRRYRHARYHNDSKFRERHIARVRSSNQKSKEDKHV